MRWVLIAATAFAVLLHVALMGFEEQCARQEIQRLHQRIRLAEQLRSVERARYQAALFKTVQSSVVAVTEQNGAQPVEQLSLEGHTHDTERHPPEIAQRGVSW